MTPLTIWGAVQDGRVELPDGVDLPEGARVLVTILRDEEADFWSRVSEKSLDAIWNNPEDDVYNALLED